MTELVEIVPVIHKEEEKSVNQCEVTEYVKTINSIYVQLREGFDNHQLDENNIVEFVVRVMSMVEQQKNLNGMEKKAVVMEILQRLVDSYERLNYDSKDKIKLLIRAIVPGLIDTIVMATKGVLAVNKKIEEVVKKSCFCCFSKK
jgi:hypothetical protein